MAANPSPMIWLNVGPNPYVENYLLDIYVVGDGARQAGLSIDRATESEAIELGRLLQTVFDQLGVTVVWGRMGRRTQPS